MSRTSSAMIESVMTDPFSLARPSTLVAAGEALDALLSSCWPRISEAEHAGQIIRIITLAWLNLQDQGDEDPRAASTSAKDRICKQLLKSMRMFKSIWDGQDLEMQRKLSQAVSQEPRLAVLFPEYAPPSMREHRALTEG